MFWIFKHPFNFQQVHTPLLTYRYHNNGYTKSLHRVNLLKIRVTHFEETVLKGRPALPSRLIQCDPTITWDSFSIWGGGRDARKFYMTLSVIHLCSCCLSECLICDFSRKRLREKWKVSTTLIQRRWGNRMWIAGRHKASQFAILVKFVRPSSFVSRQIDSPMPMMRSPNYRIGKVLIIGDSFR